MFSEVSSKVSFPEMEEAVIKLWAEQDTFKKSVESRKGGKEFVFYDGPPFATGLPHYGHLLAGTIKDIIPRYQAMRGHYVSRRFGWDCHGLPIEALAQEALGLAGAGLAATIGTWVAARNLASDLEASCPDDRCDAALLGPDGLADLDRYKTLRTTTIALGVVTGALAAAGATLVVTAELDAADEAVALVLGVGQVGIDARF